MVAIHACVLRPWLQAFTLLAAHRVVASSLPRGRDGPRPTARPRGRAAGARRAVRHRAARRQRGRRRPARRDVFRQPWPRNDAGPSGVSADRRRRPAARIGPECRPRTRARKGTRMEWEVLATLETGRVRRAGRFVVVDLDGPHRVLSTSARTGGESRRRAAARQPSELRGRRARSARARDARRRAGALSRARLRRDRRGAGEHRGDGHRRQHALRGRGARARRRRRRRRDRHRRRARATRPAPAIRRAGARAPTASCGPTPSPAPSTRCCS